MKQCWSEGELRAYLDGELPPEAMERAAAHLSDCEPCAASFEALSARAHRILSLLGELSGAGASACLPPIPVKRSRPRWIPAIAALAACLALAFVLLPKRTKQPAIPTAAAPAPTAPAPVPKLAQAAQPARPHKRKLPRKPQIQYFLALDDDPFEVGVVRRVALGPLEIPADVVFGPDGRARAIRLVNDTGN
jgi:anti-sigma factor RsiW